MAQGIEGQVEIPVPRPKPFEVTMLGRAVGDLDRAAMTILDGLDLPEMLVFLAQCKEQLEHLGQTIAAVEARCAQVMPRAKFTAPELGIRAERQQGYRYTWEERRLLFDVLLERALVAERATLAQYDGLAGADLEQAVDDLRKQASTETWELVDLLLKLGRWDPRSTALQEAFGWTREDVAQYRKAERTRRTVKVTLGDPGKAEDDGDPDEDGAAAGGVAGPGDVAEGEDGPGEAGARA